MLRTTYTDPKIFPECFLTSKVNEHVFKDYKVTLFSIIYITSKQFHCKKEKCVFFHCNEILLNSYLFKTITQCHHKHLTKPHPFSANLSCCRVGQKKCTDLTPLMNREEYKADR